ncbi:MAG: SDR family oxidoreductase [Candidatus Nitrosotenuis sp.]|nr:SDR family oxidoreductase [Candidatus Nitrosotenuis sp.]
MKLGGRVVLVTGASRGIGRAIAELFASEGATVVITAKDQKRLQKTAGELGVFGIAADIRNDVQVKNTVKKIISRFGRLDILVNNAGVLPRIKKLHLISEKEWNDVIDVNLTGQFRFTKYAIPHLQKNGGSILNISSNAGLKAYDNFNADAYTASKGALILLTKSWALQYAKDGIRVNCICPGAVETDMTKEWLSSPADRKFLNAEYPIGRIGTVGDVARAALFFASDDASWVTGAVLALDGGESAK